MHVTGLALEQTIRDLARLDLEGKLAEMLQQHSLECRGWTSDEAQLFTANELIHVSVVAKALSVLFDLPDKECQAAVRSQLLRHPRRETALQLLDYFCGRSAVQVVPLQTLNEPLPRGAIQGKLSTTATE
jgi:hypothetical protein